MLHEQKTGESLLWTSRANNDTPTATSSKELLVADDNQQEVMIASGQRTERKARDQCMLAQERPGELRARARRARFRAQTILALAALGCLLALIIVYVAASNNQQPKQTHRHLHSTLVTANSSGNCKHQRYKIEHLRARERARRSLNVAAVSHWQRSESVSTIAQLQQQLSSPRISGFSSSSGSGGNSTSATPASNGCQSAGGSFEANNQQQQRQPSSSWPSDKQLAPPDELSDQSFGFTQPKVSDFVKPVFYTLRLKVDPTKRKFTGQLMIQLEVGPASGVSQQAAGVGSTGNSNGEEEPQTVNSEQIPQSVGRDKSGELGHRYITLHAAPNIQIRKAFYVFTSRNSVQIPATKIGRNVETELLTLDFQPNVITSGQGLLLIVYAGIVNETNSQGLFVHRSVKPKRFQPAEGSGGSSAAAARLIEDAGLATHMQPTFARRLFPCWDEPHLKARFNLIVVLPFRNYVSLSNMPVKKKSISLSCSGESMQEIEFHTTPTMSTYLLTLVIGRFEYIESITANNCRIRAYFYANSVPQIAAQSDQQPAANQLQQTDQKQQQQQQQQQQQRGQPKNLKKQAAQMALDVAVKTFDLLEVLLGVKYPLSKFDMIALRDFSSGGMENWGASIFRESYLLHDNSSAQLGAEIQMNGGKSRPKRVGVPLVVAHEIAHQWFGNLVTASSWTYLWLNEGFAQLFMYELADSQFSEENYWHIFVEDSRQPAMRDDEMLSSSRPLEFETDKANELSDLFDHITYNKGAMIARTMRFLLGRDQFYAGLRHYLIKHSYGAVSSHDLWLALEESTGRADKQLESLMTPWLRQEGYPLVSVLVFEETNHYRLRLTQERFLLFNVDSHLSTKNGGRPAIPARLDWTGWTWPVSISISSEVTPSLREWQLTAAVGSSSSSSPPPTSAFLFQDRQADVLLPKEAIGSWLKLNFNATGYFRVDYLQPQSQSQQQQQLSSAVDVLARMAPAVRSKRMCVIDRFNLADDLFAMVKAGKKSTDFYLRYLIEAFSDETEIIVLRAIVESLNSIKAIVSNLDVKLNARFDRYAQKYLAKVGRSIESERATLLAATMPRDTNQATTFQREREAGDKQQQQSLVSTSRVRLQQLKEIEDLIDAQRIQFNDPELVQRAANLFSSHFRQASKGPFDSMDREMRASVYLGALTSASNEDADLGAEFALNDELPGLAVQQQQQQQQQQQSSSSSFSFSSSSAASGGAQLQDPIAKAYSSLSSISLAPVWTDQNATATKARLAPATNAQQQQQLSDDVFLKLLRAYEASESGGDRYAISWALGAIALPNKRLKLLNLTLFEPFFRSHDSVTLLDSMARQRVGRQLIWTALKTNVKAIERRGLLAGLLKSLASGLIETQELAGESSSSSSNSMANEALGSGEQIEAQLRSLYQTYGRDYEKTFVQSIEILRINSQWFHRDHVPLRLYLESGAFE